MSLFVLCGTPWLTLDLRRGYEDVCVTVVGRAVRRRLSRSAWLGTGAGGQKVCSARNQRRITLTVFFQRERYVNRVATSSGAGFW